MEHEKIQTQEAERSTRDVNIEKSTAAASVDASVNRAISISADLKAKLDQAGKDRQPGDGLRKEIMTVDVSFRPPSKMHMPKTPRPSGRN